MKKKPLRLCIGLLLGLLISGCTLFAPEPTSTPTLTATATQTASPTTTLTPTVTLTPTLEPTPTITNTPTPTPDPLNEILTNMDVLASYYSQDVVIEVSEDPVLVPYYVPQFSVAVPPLAYFQSSMDLSETGNTKIDGYFLNSSREFNIGTSPWAENLLPLPRQMGEITISQIKEKIFPDGNAIREEYEILDLGTKGAVFTTIIFEYPDHYVLVEELNIVEDYSPELDIYILYDFTDEYESLEALEAVIEPYREELISLHDNFTIMDTYFEMAHTTMPLEIYSGVCPTAADPTYGFTLENPIRMLRPVSDNFIEAAFAGPALADNYFHTLLYNGQPVNWVRQGSTHNAESIIDIYEITGPTITTPIILYVDQYTAQPYLVPSGFGCNGILYPDHYLSYEPVAEE